MKYRPYSDFDQYIQVHMVLFDHVMPSVGANSWKVLCFILRKTIGWRKSCDSISYEQIKTGTGIKTDATVRSALIELMGLTRDVNDDGLLVWRETKPVHIFCTNPGGFQSTNSYRLNFDLELDLPVERGTARGSQTEETN